MKTQIGVAISIAGVLIAGSAAALVNSQVFESSPNESGASAAVQPEPSTVDLTIPTETQPSTSAPSTSVAPPTAASAAPVTGMLTAFDVGSAGVVTVDVIEGRLVFVSAEALAGWAVVEQSDDNDEDSDDSADEVEVVFESATVRVVFEAELIGGQIVPEVESASIGARGASPGLAAPSTSGSSSGQPPVTAHDDSDDRYDDSDDDRDDDRDDDDRDDDSDDDDRDDDSDDDDRDDDSDDDEEDDRDDD